MFFLGGGSSILPYLLYLALIWGIFLLNGILDTSIKKEMKEKTGTVCATKNASKSIRKNTYHFEKQPRANQHSGKNHGVLHDNLQFRFQPQKFRVPLITHSIIKNVFFSFLLRGPPIFNFTVQF